EPGTWDALVRPASRLRPGALVEIGENGTSALAEVGERLASGARELRLREGASATPRALALGRPPLPPYIKGWSGDAERYQTVYGDRVGSAAAPTAGLHFTRPLLERLRERGVGLAYVTLHVGVDTFRPMRGTQVDAHEMHA